MLVCLIASWDSSSQRTKKVHTDSVKLWNGFIYKGGRTGLEYVKKREQIMRLSQVAGTGFCIERILLIPVNVSGLEEARYSTKTGE